MLAIVLSISILLPACTEQTPQMAKTITLWHYYNADIKAQFDALVQNFNETVGKEKGIMVDAYSLGGVNELSDAVYAAANKDIGSKEMPNIFSAYSDSALRIDALGAVAPLDEYFSKEELSRYRPEFIEDGRFAEDRSLKIIPVAKSTELAFLNLTAYEKFAADTGADLSTLSTWEGIVDTAKKYYEWSGGKAFFGIDSMANFMILGSKQLGSDIFTTDIPVKFNLSRDHAKKLWDTYHTPYINGYFSAVGRFCSDDVKSGSIIMFIGSNSSASYFPKTIETGKDTSYETQSQVLPYPHFEGKDLYCVQQGAGMVVSKSDPETEKACVEFLKWLTDPKQNVEFAARTSYLPVENEALSHETTMEALNLTDASDIRFQTSQAVYKMLDTYKLYAAKPFEESFNARSILESSLRSYTKNDFNAMTQRVAAGENREALIAEYCGETNFEAWYQSLVNEMDALMR
ncbi:MAG: extracellular solute-binding protein [Evtepia sp.]